MEGSADYCNIVTAVDNAIRESYYTMFSNKMSSDKKMNTDNIDPSMEYDSEHHTTKDTKKHATSTDAASNRHNELEHISDNVTDLKAIMNAERTVKAAPRVVINKSILDQKANCSNDNVDDPNKNIDKVTGLAHDSQGDTQADNHTLRNMTEDVEEINESEKQINAFDNTDNAKEDNTMLLRTEETGENTDVKTGIYKNQVSTVLGIKSDDNDNGTTGVTEKWLNCRDCGDTFPNAYHLSQHKRMVCGSSTMVRSHRCQLCERLFSSSSRLRKHLRTHLGTKPYKCNICQKQFTQSHNLKRHILIHTGEQPFQCRICTLNFTCAANAKRHIKVKHAKDVEASADAETFIETLIKRTAPTSISLKDKSFASILEIPAEESEEIIMPKRRKFDNGKVCLICLREFSRSSHLRDHMYSHTGERPYKCHICDYSTTFKSGLNKHLRIHSGVKPYSCAFCEKTFYSPTDRDTHQVQIHSKEKDFVCGVCDAQFAKPYMLKRHVKHCHMSEYEHTCDACNKQFKTEAVLRRHKLKYCHGTNE